MASKWEIGAEVADKIMKVATQKEYQCMIGEATSLKFVGKLATAAGKDIAASGKPHEGTATADLLAALANSCKISATRQNAFRAVVYNYWGNTAKAHKYDPKNFPLPTGGSGSGGGGGGGSGSASEGGIPWMWIALGVGALLVLRK